MQKSSLITLVSAGFTAFGFSPAAGEEVQFNRDIRPILSEYCFSCHGPDAHERKADLRLDVKDGGAFEDHDGVTSIVPGDLEKSELIYRIITDDDEEVMPPPKSGKKLGTEEIELLKKWVKSGAEYQGHWAYEPPKKANVPEADHPVDHFIDRRLKEEGMVAAPPADPHVLIRRLTFDITGLPPSQREVEKFEAEYTKDPEKAIRDAVERLLASPRYGERMASYWLDLVRYADSIGYHSDNPMNVYLYREWVIDALNANKPFDQFTREQIAGDLLPDATVEQKVASGYNRLLQTTEEGGAQAKEYVAIYAADRVRNVSGAWLGGTLGCAQCHDHKYDPFTMRDFYSMAAFFADIKEPAVGKREAGMVVATGDYKKQVADLDKKIADLTKLTTSPTPETEAAVAKWEKTLDASAAPALGEWHLIGPFAAGDPNKAFEQEFGPEKGFDSKQKVSGKEWKARPDFKDGVVHALPQDGNSAWYLHRTIEVSAPSPLALSLGSDDGIRVWLNGAEVHKNNVGRAAAPDQEKVTLNLNAGTNHFLMKISNGGGGCGFYFKSGGSNLPPDIAAILKIPAEKRDAGQKNRLETYYVSVAPELADERAALVEVKKQREELEKNLPKTLVSMSGNPRQMRILPRGNWLDDSGEEVGPAIPGFLGKLEPAETRATRLDLANWIVDPGNPLTARTFVNRLWQLFYGKGLSRNTDDLGSQGYWPTHPELLDWLAVEFIESGWDVKHMVRLLVTADAYARSTDRVKANGDKDLGNKLLAKQSRFRLDAEMVRDNALLIGGILVERIGGESAKPYQPAGYWRHLNFPARKYSHDTDEDQYRRALYTHWQRSFLHPSLLAFDAPSREECTAARPRSNTPLQALVLLNDPTYVEAARAFAERIISEGGASPEDKIKWAVREALSREPSGRETKVLMDLFKAQHGRYSADEAAAKEVMSNGMRQPAASIAVVDLAAWTAVSRAVLNLHETITRP